MLKLLLAVNKIVVDFRLLEYVEDENNNVWVVSFSSWAYLWQDGSFL